MNKKQLSLLGLILTVLVSSCALFQKRDIDSFYNKRNREKVKLKSGVITSLFSAKSVQFGQFSTPPIEEDIDNSIIRFPNYSQPFHFNLSERGNEIAKVQAVYTELKTFSKDTLPDAFYASAISEIFYAKIKGIGLDSLDDWHLILKHPSYQEVDNQHEIGTLYGAHQQVKIFANNRFGKHHNYDRLIYEFRYHQLPVAAVEVGGKGYVWTGPGLDNQIKNGVMGAVAAILLR